MGSPPSAIGLLDPPPASPPAAGVERDRVARELHAVVARGLEAIAEQASLARALLGVDDAAAGEHVARIPDTVLATLEELRGLLAALADGRLSAAERAAIARDVHDVVGHGVSLAGVLAGAAQATMGRDREAARRTLEQLQATVDETTGELAGLLGPLAVGRPPGGELAAPDCDLTALVRCAAASGQPVALTVDGTLDAVPAGVRASLHRIVQEALTNARKHAPGAAVDVRVAAHADRVTVAVVNGPAPGRQPPAGRGCGRGLPGMRERARLLGGALDAAPAPDGGFAVRAELPWRGLTAGAARPRPPSAA